MELENYIENMETVIQDFYKFRFIKTPQSGRRFVVSDLHGCYRSFKQLLKKIKLKKEDHLYILGDFISRGPENYKTLKKIISLRKECYKIFCLRGNHEHQIIEALRQSSEELLMTCANNGVLRILNESIYVRDNYRLFFKSLPYMYELDNFYLSHAGFDFQNDPLTNYDAMITIREYQPDVEVLNGKILIHGHVPQQLDAIIDTIEKQNQIINIDNGCVLGENQQGFGNLICLNIDTFEYTVQPNIEN